MFNDTPNIWTGDDLQEECTEIIETPAEADLVPLPTREESLDIIKGSSITEEHKTLLTSLTEMNEVSKVLATLRDNETQEQRKSIIRAWSENFITVRFQNNGIIEKLKRKLLERLLDNVENLDLETTHQILSSLQDVTSIDAQTAMSQIMGTGAVGGGGGNNSPTFNINVANGDNASATANTMNVGAGPNVSQLKEVAAMNNNLNAWNNVNMPRKEKNVTDVTPEN
jgi:hypothetical protein